MYIYLLFYVAVLYDFLHTKLRYKIFATNTDNLIQLHCLKYSTLIIIIICFQATNDKKMEKKVRLCKNFVW